MTKSMKLMMGDGMVVKQKIDLKAMKERCRKATAKPWAHKIDRRYSERKDFDDLIISECPEGANVKVVVRVKTSDHLKELRGDIDAANNDFIAHSRSDMETLIEAVEQAREIFTYIQENYDLIPVIGYGLHGRIEQFLSRFADEGEGV